MRGDQIRILQGRGVSEVRAEEEYTFFVDNLIAGQKNNIPYRTIRSQKNDPKWMTTRLKHIIGLKTNMLKRLKQA